MTRYGIINNTNFTYPFIGIRENFLMDQLRKTGTDELLKKELEKGKLMIGESAGAIICAPTIQYIEQMDEKPEDYSQEDDAGLDLIDFYVLPHYLTAPFKKVTEKIMTEFSDLNLCPINNRQGIVIDRAEEVILHTYNRFQIVLDKGNGVHLYDVDGKEYLDFAAGIAVFALAIR